MDYTKSMMNRPDRTNILKTYKNPVLFIAGKHDNAVPFEQTMQQVHLPQLSYIHILESRTYGYDRRAPKEHRFFCRSLSQQHINEKMKFRFG